jgi:hypothetical protein
MAISMRIIRNLLLGPSALKLYLSIFNYAPLSARRLMAFDHMTQIQPLLGYFGHVFVCVAEECHQGLTTHQNVKDEVDITQDQEEGEIGVVQGPFAGSV